MLRQVRSDRHRPRGRPRRGRPERAAPSEVADICASFQRVVVETLLDRPFEAASWLGARSVGIAGGVSANSRLRADAAPAAVAPACRCSCRALALSTDNAAMIGAAGFRTLARHGAGPWDFNADAGLALR